MFSLLSLSIIEVLSAKLVEALKRSFFFSFYFFPFVTCFRTKCFECTWIFHQLYSYVKILRGLKPFLLCSPKCCVVLDSTGHCVALMTETGLLLFGSSSC